MVEELVDVALTMEENQLENAGVSMEKLTSLAQAKQNLDNLMGETIKSNQSTGNEGKNVFDKS